MKLFFYCFFILISSVLYSQDTIFNYQNYLPVNDKKIKEFHSYYNEADGNTLLLIADKKHLYSYLLDADFKEIEKGVIIDFDQTKYYISGIGGAGKEYHLFLSYHGNTKWDILTIDFETNSSELKEVDLKLKRSSPINFFTRNNQLHLITLRHKSSIISIHKISGDASMSSLEYDLSYFDFGEGRRSLNNLDQVLNVNSASFESDVIDFSNPISLNSSSNTLKIYHTHKDVTLTIDYEEQSTYIVNLNLHDTGNTVKKIPKTESVHFSSRSNSLLFEDKVFGIKTSDKDLIFTITDTETLEVLKEYKVLSKDTIGFKNTPIILEGGSFEKYRELESTKQFLKKTTASNPAISVYKDNDVFVVTLGASKNKDVLTPILISTTFGGIVAIAIATAISASTSGLFSDYVNTKSTRFLTVLDNNLNHLKNKEIPKNSFDKIKQYLEAEKPDALISILNTNKGFVLCLLDIETNEITGLRF